MTDRHVTVVAYQRDPEHASVALLPSDTVEGAGLPHVSLGEAYELVWQLSEFLVQGKPRSGTWRPKTGSDLTDDELTALSMVALGRTHQWCAQRLGISRWSFRKRLERACDRLGAFNTLHAVYLAMQKGLIQ